MGCGADTVFNAKTGLILRHGMAKNQKRGPDGNGAGLAGRSELATQPSGSTGRAPFRLVRSKTYRVRCPDGLLRQLENLAGLGQAQDVDGAVGVGDGQVTPLELRAMPAGADRFAAGAGAYLAGKAGTRRTAIVPFTKLVTR
jgi:hypothetical protein